MAEKITDKQVSDLLVSLRSDAPIDTKVAQVTALKSGIKQHNVPDSCVMPAFEALRNTLTSQHAALVNAGFTALGHLLTRLSRQEPKFLIKEAARTLPLLVEKMGDQKEKYRALAIQSMTTLWLVAPMDVERSVRNAAMVGKNARAKESSLQWLLQMHKENGLQFRSYVPTLMELLEDADGMVRDATKATVIELFRNAPNPAKSDLKRQLKNFKVRPAIEQAIVKELAPTASAPTPEPRPAPDIASAPSRVNLSASVSSLPSERPVTPMLEGRPDPVEPTYVNTQRELDETLRDMQVWFEGKETEQNWLKREESVTKLRRLLAGNAPSDFPDAFLTGLRVLLDGTIKAVISLRTSLSKEGCSLVQDMANTFGPAVDPMVELLMQTFIKLCAATKKISSQLANVTVDTLVGKVTYNARIMQHIWGACQDKNVQPRSYSAGWVKTLIKKEAHRKSHIEHTGGLDLIEKCIKKGLADPNPGVREQMRSTYWVFAGIWPARAEGIMNGLDATAQKLLQRDPNNPNSPKKSETPARPGMGFSKSTISTSKPSLRETMMAQKKATLAAGRNVPARPGSAMAQLDHGRTTSIVPSSSSATAPATRQRPESKHVLGTGGLSGAPMRPTRKRPEMAARPATAGPYSVRSHDHASAEASSPPDNFRAKTVVTPKAMQASPKRTVPRTRPGHTATASESSISSPSKPDTAKDAAKATTSRTTPVKAPAAPAPAPAMAFVARQLAPETNSPSRAHEELTLVVPSIGKLTSQAQAPDAAIESVAEEIEEPESISTTPVESLKVYEDPFTEQDQTTPRPVFMGPVLEDKPVNEDAANLARADGEIGVLDSLMMSPEKAKQNSRLLDSGISKVKAQALDVHGFRKLQGIIRDNKAPFTDDKFEALLTGLFGYLEAPLTNLAPEKVQDVKAQILATIKLLLKKARDNFQPHISQGLEALLATRSAYDARTHIVSGLELLADELVTLGDASEIVVVLTRLLQETEMDVPGYRSLSMGLHVLRSLIDSRTSYQPSDRELAGLGGLASRCLESTESGVRMDAVQLCVALHSRVGDVAFWEVVKGVKDDPKSLITYYIVKRQREREAVAA